MAHPRCKQSSIQRRDFHGLKSEHEALVLQPQLQLGVLIRAQVGDNNPQNRPTERSNDAVDLHPGHLHHR